MCSLKRPVKLSALLYKPCASYLVSIHTGGNNVASSRPEESMRPVHQMVLSRKLPDSVTSSHKQTKHTFRKFGNVMGPVENHA